MTFFEAAVEVLRRTGRPLHYKKITEVAVRDNLLSHVGKAPDQTMSNRLTQEVNRQGKSVIVQTRPGVYSIRDGEMERLNKEAKKREEKEKKRRKARPSRQKQDDSQKQQARSDKQDDSNGRRKRRRRRSRKSDDEATAQQEEGRRRARGSRSKRRDRSEDKSKKKADKKDEKSDKKSGARKRRGGKSNKSNRRKSNKGDRRKSRKEQKTTNDGGQFVAELTRHLDEGPVRLDGIAEAAYTVLQDANGEPMDIEDLADEIFERKLVKFHTHDAAATVQAALANDNQIRSQRGHRPLFTQHNKQHWGLSEWGLPNEAVQKEQSILSLSEAIRQDTGKHLGDALADVQDEALEHIALTLLERLGYQNIKVSKRSSNGDVYFTADWRQGLADVRVCIQVTLSTEDELGPDAVSALRDTLHHYSAAEGVIIHLGDISNKAVAESRHEDKEPITLIDQDTFVELLIKHGIGVKAYTTPILMVDTTFIETLKS